MDSTPATPQPGADAAHDAFRIGAPFAARQSPADELVADAVRRLVHLTASDWQLAIPSDCH